MSPFQYDRLFGIWSKFCDSFNYESVNYLLPLTREADAAAAERVSISQSANRKLLLAISPTFPNTTVDTQGIPTRA